MIGLLLSAGILLAGSLNPSAGPTGAASQMFTLQQIYDRLTGGGDATKMTTFTEPSSGPTAGTMRTLDELYALALPARVPKTGQTTSLAAGDDGELQKGVAWPTPRFTDNSNGTVTDNLTGLIWLKNANCAAATRDWATALTDVASLNSAGTMGNDPIDGPINCGDTSNNSSHQTDWRLPNVREMQSLVDYGHSEPALPSDSPFTGVQTGTDSNFYWTSTTLARVTSIVWLVGLRDGFVGFDAKEFTYYYVWPVRGGQ